MPRPEPARADRARGALLGLALGGDATAPLALLLAEELLAPEVDLRRLADRWIGWVRRDGRGVDDWTRTALEHIARHDSPPSAMPAPVRAAGLGRAIPVALAASRSPRNLVSGTWHVVALTHPDPRCTWGAVAVNVAVACFLDGRRDIVPDVVEALRNNDAPAELLAAVRRVPLERWEEIGRNGDDAPPVVLDVERALWCAHHAPDLDVAADLLACDGDRDALPLVGALLGARDGIEGRGAGRLASVPAAAQLRSAADRLIGAA
ncbi:MAG TPA: ADP-ribosylglycohydrolase family protein [Gemmatimonadales bacterium]|nr:ADP-ribosylglycohydrolase family protein [Gemmatimonadales bacterium]